MNYTHTLALSLSTFAVVGGTWGQKMQPSSFELFCWRPSTGGLGRSSPSIPWRCQTSSDKLTCWKTFVSIPHAALARSEHKTSSILFSFHVSVSTSYSDSKMFSKDLTSITTHVHWRIQFSLQILVKLSTMIPIWLCAHLSLSLSLSLSLCDMVIVW